MDISKEIKFEISYGIGSVSVFDVNHKKYYTENFVTFLPLFYRFFSKRAEKKAINKAMNNIAHKIFQEHQNLMN